LKEKRPLELITATFVDFLAHTGQSSQLFPVTTGRNAQFLATVTRSGFSLTSRKSTSGCQGRTIPSARRYGNEKKHVRVGIVDVCPDVIRDPAVVLLTIAT
jgi:hypothetical protein